MCNCKKHSEEVTIIQIKRDLTTGGIGTCEEKETYEIVPYLESSLDKNVTTAQRCFLWKVKTNAPMYCHETIFVLAESEFGAVSQACCRFNVSYNLKKELESFSKAEKVPFMMRGWAAHTF